MSYASPAEINKSVAEILRPPRRMRVSDAAEKYVRVVTGGGSSVPWDPNITPYMIEPMNCSTRRDLESVVFAGPARSGKTEGLGDCRLSHAVLCDPGDMMMLFPSEVLAGDYSKRRLRRLHRHSREVGAMLSPSRHDDAVAMKFYRNGMILNLAWPTSSQVAQRDIRYVLLSDYDSMPDDIEGEGSGYDLAKKRTQTFMSSGMTIAESSPKKEIIDPKFRRKGHEAPPVIGGILPLYNRGDRRLWYWTCKGCGELFECPPMPQYDDLADIQAASETAFVGCPQCGHVHRPADKRELNIGGTWLREGEAEGNPRKSTIASFWVKGCAAAFQPWQSIVLEYLRGLAEYEQTGVETKLKTTINIDQGMPYLAKSKENTRTADELTARAESWTRGEVPEGVLWLQFVADVQKNSFVVQVFGHGLDRERWLIDRYSIQISDRITQTGERDTLDPAGYIEDWAKLTAATKKTYPLADGTGRHMRIMFSGCDSGGYSKKKSVNEQTGVTMRSYTWWRGLKRAGMHRRTRLIKGGSAVNAQAVKETFPDAANKRDRHSGAKGDVPVLLLNTDQIKDAMSADLRRKDPGPGYIHLPEWLEDNVFEEFVSEARGPRGWEKLTRQTRNEAWDLLAYDSALSIHFGGARVKAGKEPRWAKGWNENECVIQPGDKVQSNTVSAKDFKVI